jgi:hypothetical protein
MILNEIAGLVTGAATRSVGGVPAWIVVVAVLLGATGVWYYQERSARGVRRRAEGGGRKAAAGATVAAGGVGWALLGVGQELSAAAAGLFLNAPDTFAYLGTALLGYLSLNGDVALSASWFAAIAGLLFVVAMGVENA